MSSSPVDWDQVRLIVFDVDGTLYAQERLRMRMALRLAWHCATTLSPRTAFVLRDYRRLREEFGDAEVEDFEERLLGDVARKHAVPESTVRDTVRDWIETRPLPMLASCRYPALDALFARIRTSGRSIGILSDYQAEEKLRAMNLEADHILGAGDVGILKPHPRGLLTLMERAGMTASQTVMIGDRAERDGEAARRAGVPCLIRSEKPVAGHAAFTRYDDPVFDGLATAPIRPATTLRTVGSGS